MVLLKNDVSGGGIPLVGGDVILDVLDVSAKAGYRTVQIISGYRGPLHTKKSIPHEFHRAIDVKIDGYNSKEVGDFLFYSGHFARVNSYTDKRRRYSAHADYWGSSKNPVRFIDWKRQKGYGQEKDGQ